MTREWLCTRCHRDFCIEVFSILKENYQADDHIWSPLKAQTLCTSFQSCKAFRLLFVLFLTRNFNISTLDVEGPFFVLVHWLCYWNLTLCGIMWKSKVTVNLSKNLYVTSRSTELKRTMLKCRKMFPPAFSELAREKCVHARTDW